MKRFVWVICDMHAWVFIDCLWLLLAALIWLSCLLYIQPLEVLKQLGGGRLSEIFTCTIYFEGNFVKVIHSCEDHEN